MLVPVLLALAEITFALVLIFRVLRKYQRSTVHLLFAGMLLCLVVWLFGAAMGYTSNRYPVAVAWFKVASFGFIFLHAFTLHFTLAYAGYRLKNLAVKILIYLPSIVFFTISLCRLVIFKDFVQVDGVWMGIPAYSDPLFYLMVGHYASYYLAVFILLIRKVRAAVYMREKRQGLIILASILITEILFNVDPFVMPLLLNRPAFVYAPLFSIIWMFGIWVALRYYKLLGVYPGRLFEQILSQITDIVIFVDLGFRVLFANELAFRRLQPDTGSSGLPARQFDGYLERYPVIRDRLQAFIQTGQQSEVLTSYLGSPEEKRLWRLRLTRIDDRFHDYHGVLIVIQDLASSRNLKEQFGLTEREIEVLALVVDDRSNQEIATALGIGLRTVKSHLTHIFMKTKTRNRVGLVNLVYDQD
jgi:DNA-binding CsgD family transcriptional regulator